MSKAIGGYFGLELKIGDSKDPHSNAYCVNSGTNALHCILETLKPAKLLIPRLLCDVIIDPLKILNIPFEFYPISRSFKPIIENLEPGTFLLYINYFGVCDSVVSELAETYSGNLIIDNTQAFFSKPIQGVPTFYSTRKFFGVPDGAYFYGVDFDLSTLPRDISWDRCTHLLKRIDLSAQEGYSAFVRNDELIFRLKPARMSILTSTILKSVDYQRVRQTRVENYSYLHSVLRESNDLKEYLPDESPSISYPYLLKTGSDVRSLLVDMKIFLPKFWPNIQMLSHRDSTENRYSEHILHLPIDQRYGREELNYIISSLEKVSQ